MQLHAAAQCGKVALLEDVIVSQLFSFRVHFSFTRAYTAWPLIDMQVQGRKCTLHLAITDRSSLQTLLALLPLKGFAQLDFNVPYLPEGAAPLLEQAAALQAAGRSSNQQTQPPFSVGVWVCCWGGCTGISLADALQIQQQLQLVGCAMHGIESVNCSSAADVAALVQLKGLRALGFNYKSSSRTGDSGSSSEPDPPGGVGQHTGHSSTGTQAQGESDENTGALGSLAPLSSSLQQLTIHGCPEGGFGQQCSAATPALSCQQHKALAVAVATPTAHSNSYSSSVVPGQDATAAAVVAGAAAMSPQQHPLACLTGLTKLSLLKQWAKLPLPVAPIAHLTALLELALERTTLAHPAELSCLSSLCRLKVLSLVLAVTAEELKDKVRQGQWQLVAPEQASQQQACTTSQPSHQHSPHSDEQHAALAALAALAAHGQQVASTLRMLCLDELQQQPCAAQASEAGDACMNIQQAVEAEGQAAAATAAGACPALLQGHSCVSSTALLDWSWLRQLKQLEVAWFQVGQAVRP